MNIFSNIFNKKIKNTIIVKVDGGICSQIAFIAYAKYLLDKGFEVKLDLTWYKLWGKGADGRFELPYKINEAFFDIDKFEIATDEEIKKISKIKSWEKFPVGIDEINAPYFINSYPPERFDCVIKYKNYFKEKFKPFDIDTIKDLVEKIDILNSCAIHVRRGDLNVYNPVYGYPIEKEYFINSAKIIKSYNPDAKFFFFSDEPDWIKENLINEPIFKNSEIINRNPSEKGYLDLYLLTKARYIIASHGSFGLFGKILSDNNPLIIMPKCAEEIIKNFDNCIYLNEDYRLKLKYIKKENTQTSN